MNHHIYLEGLDWDNNTWPKFLSVADVCQITGLKEKRLLELCLSGHAPHIKIDDGPPVFLKKSIVPWVKGNLLRIEEGRDLDPLPVLVQKSAPLDVPIELCDISDQLFEMPFLKSSGVYFLIKSGKIVYVGQSRSVYSRIMTHGKEKDFDRALFLRVPESRLNQIEAAFIGLLKPALNQTKTHGFPNGNGEAFRNPRQFLPISLADKVGLDTGSLRNDLGEIPEIRP